MNEVNKLKNKLYGKDGLGVTNFNVFPGSKKVDIETLAKEINQAIFKIENGDFEIED